MYVDWDTTCSSIYNTVDLYLLVLCIEFVITEYKLWSFEANCCINWIKKHPLWLLLFLF